MFFFFKFSRHVAKYWFPSISNETKIRAEIKPWGRCFWTPDSVHLSPLPFPVKTSRPRPCTMRDFPYPEHLHTCWWCPDARQFQWSEAAACSSNSMSAERSLTIGVPDSRYRFMFWFLGVSVECGGPPAKYNEDTSYRVVAKLRDSGGKEVKISSGCQTCQKLVIRFTNINALTSSNMLLNSLTRWYRCV